MSVRQAATMSISAALYIAAAAAIAALLPSERSFDPALAGALVIGYALASRVRFEFGEHYVSPELLVFIPMVLLAPLPYVPAMVALAAVLAVIPDVLDRSWHGHRAIAAVADCWFAMAPVLVLAALAPGGPELHLAWAFVLAFLAQAAVDFIWGGLVRDGLIDRARIDTVARDFLGTQTVDALLAPIGFAVAYAAQDSPLLLLSILPLIVMLDRFSLDRRERYSAALELQRAYRGTVMLLSDVVEFEDPYTARHSRSVVDLVNAVADELGVRGQSRQELEFAAMLHDIGKIAIPREILEKPAALTDAEYEVVKTHTIEGQYMLDRVGGLLARVGEIVRSCHERWDGGGYPDGLTGTEIPLPARIVFACDAYHAMTSDRVYRRAMPVQAALEELARHRGSQFDPNVVDALARVVMADGVVVDLSTDAVRGLLAGAAAPAPERKVGLTI